MPINFQGNKVFEVADSPGDHDGVADSVGLPDYRCPAHAKLTTYFVKHDRYDNYWVCGLYKSGAEQRLESYVVTKFELMNAFVPSHLVVSAIREINDRLARYINQPLYL